MSEPLKTRALALYEAPFTFKRGYVFDSAHHMVSDDGPIAAEDKEPGAVQRVRGWGRIVYMAEAEALQDTMGEIMAEALNDYWAKHRAAIAKAEGQS